MRVENVTHPVCAPNSKGGPAADPERHPYVERWTASRGFVHPAYTPHEEDDDLVQPRALVNDVMDDGARDRLVSNVVGHLRNDVPNRS